MMSTLKRVYTRIKRNVTTKSIEDVIKSNMKNKDFRDRFIEEQEKIIDARLIEEYGFNFNWDR